MVNARVDSLEAQFAEARHLMVKQIALHVGYTSELIGRTALANKVIEVIGRVPRHEFVPAELQGFAYLDQPLPIGYGKTISQPFMVALMTDLLDLQPHDQILEIGTGLGYQAAILANLARQVYSIEIIDELASEAAVNLRKLNYQNIELRVGDGSRGWPEQAPFTKMIVTAAPELIPTSLLNQLSPGGKMVVPAGLQDAQQLLLVEKSANGSTNIQELLPVRFTPLIVSH